MVQKGESLIPLSSKNDISLLLDWVRNGDEKRVKYR